MILGEVALFEAARLQNRHCERIAHDQSCGGAGSWGEIEGAGFSGNVDVQNNIAVAGKRGFQAAGEGNDFYREAFDGGKQIQQFIGFARIAESNHDVAVVDDAEVAVERVHAVEDDGGRASAGEGGGDFGADVAGFTDANNDDFATPAEGFADERDGGIE